MKQPHRVLAFGCHRDDAGDSLRQHFECLRTNEENDMKQTHAFINERVDARRNPRVRGRIRYACMKQPRIESRCASGENPTGEKGTGKREVIRFAPTQARWVRIHGIERGASFGYSLWEIAVYH